MKLYKVKTIIEYDYEVMTIECRCRIYLLSYISSDYKYRIPL